MIVVDGPFGRDRPYHRCGEELPLAQLVTVVPEHEAEVAVPDDRD